MAWLQATPKPDPRTKRGKAADDEAAPRLSRIAQFKADKIVPGMPPNPAPHITDRLIEIGLTGTGAMTAVPLSWGEIDAWCNRTSIDLEPWEARLISRLSKAYVNQLHASEDEHCPPPFQWKVTAREREVAEEKLMAVLG